MRNYFWRKKKGVYYLPGKKSQVSDGKKGSFLPQGAKKAAGLIKEQDGFERSEKEGKEFS